MLSSSSRRPPNLPILDCLREANRLVFREWRMLLAAGWLFGCVTVFGGILSTAPSRLFTEQTKALLVAFIELMTETSFVVTWLRWLLLREPVELLHAFRFGRRELTYLVTMLIAFLPLALVAAGLLLTGFAPSGMTPGGAVANGASGGAMQAGLLPILVGMMVAAIIILLARMALFQPVIALDLPGNPLGWSFKLTRGHTPRLVLGLTLIAIELLPSMIATQDFPTIGPMLLSLIRGIAGWFSVGLSGAYAAALFRRLAPRPDPTAASPWH